jgi:hypothetical protein
MRSELRIATSYPNSQQPFALPDQFKHKHINQSINRSINLRISKLLRGGKVIRKSNICVLVLGVLSELLTSHHHRHGGLGDEVIREGSE